MRKGSPLPQECDQDGSSALQNRHDLLQRNRAAFSKHHMNTAARRLACERAADEVAC